MNINMYNFFMFIKKVFITSIIISLLIPLVTRAQIKITEIMYDPEGSDTKREWIEVYNAGSTNIDLGTYFLFENNVFHKLVAQSSTIIAPGEYAIIVDSIAEVIAEYKEFIGKIFDSAFSLNNTGETLSIANSNKEIVDTTVYTSQMGANNDGNSLQINEGEIISAGSTFGFENKTESESSATSENNSTSTLQGGSSASSNTSSHTQQESISTYTASSQFKIGIGRDRVVSTNTPIEFFVQISKADINPRISWNMGDFTTMKGKKVNHTYMYEGIYEVIAQAYHDGYTSVSRTQVVVGVPNLSITQASSTLIIRNNSKNEINIGNFRFNFMNGDSYIIPQNTIITGNTEIRKNLEEKQVVQEFVYPNGEIYKRFDTI